MFLEKKEEKIKDKLVDWEYIKLNNELYCVYIINYCNIDTLKKRVVEINNKKVIPRIDLNINDYMGFYIYNKDFKERMEEYSLSLCILDEEEPVSDEVDILNEYYFKKFVEMMDLINDTTTILEEEKENISIKSKGKELLETLDNLVTDSANDIINKPNHYQLLIKDRMVEVIDIIDSIVQNYPPKQAIRVANIIKYILRANKKNGLEDFKKAKKYIEMLLEME